MAKKPLKTGVSVNANSYPRKPDGPYTSRWHDHIEFNGDILMRLNGAIDIKTVAICMNMAYQAGRREGEQA